MFFLVPFYPASPGPKAVERLCVCVRACVRVCVCVLLRSHMHYIVHLCYVMDMASCRPMGASVARLVILVSGARSRSWN